MRIRNILYGYQIRDGVLAINFQEKAVVEHVIALYLDGYSYQRISDILNEEGKSFSPEAPTWNKHKVKRLLENPRYTGVGGYPPIIEPSVFQNVQQRIRSKTANYKTKDRTIHKTFVAEEETEVSYTI